MPIRKSADARRKQTLEPREAYIAAAHAVIAEKGVDQLSLREVAREMGVSHQAPYKHFSSRDDLLAEVIRRCFLNFAKHLQTRPAYRDAHRDLASLGRAYMRFSIEHPLEYHLMFSTPKPGGADRPDLLADARKAFDILREAIDRVHQSAGAPTERVDLDAMFVWSVMHGLATILQNNPVDKLMARPGTAAKLVPHALQLIEGALAQR
jgi:AcrR family transcriptional regulator